MLDNVHAGPCPQSLRAGRVPTAPARKRSTARRQPGRRAIRGQAARPRSYVCGHPRSCRCRGDRHSAAALRDRVDHPGLHPRGAHGRHISTASVTWPEQYETNGTTLETRPGLAARRGAARGPVRDVIAPTTPQRTHSGSITRWALASAPTEVSAHARMSRARTSARSRSSSSSIVSP